MNVLKAIGKPFTALSGKIDTSVREKILMSVIRHGATALGAVLIAKGILAPSVEGTFVNDLTEIAGVLLASAGTVSGAAQKTQ